jgi:Ca2+-binding RTX toxin-like protein
MRFLSWLEAMRGRITERDTAARRRKAKLPVAGQLEQLEGKSLLSVSALFVNGELSIVSNADDNITVGSIGAGATTRVQVLANGNPVTSVASVPTSSVTSIVVQGGNLSNAINLSGVSVANYPNLTGINVDGGHGSDTISGSNGIAETLLGNHGDDVITCLNGASSINGNDGNDTIVAGGGDDSINGDDGDDSINGGDGNDTIIGGDGNDSIDAGIGNDSVVGGDGDDTIQGGTGNDAINGMMGADSIDGGDGSDTLLGGAGADTLSGGTGDDSLLGNDGRDSLLGGDDHDSLDGGADADTLIGGAGNDRLDGLSGNDLLQGNLGDDTLRGGAGRDTLQGNEGNDSLQGQAGNDTIFGGAGFDFLDGGTGDDFEDAGEVPAPPATPAPIQPRLFAIPADNRNQNQIVELDPRTGAEINRFAAPETTNANGDGLAFDGTSLYYLNGFGTGTLYQLEPNTGAVIHSTEIPRPTNQRYDGLAALNGLIYIMDAANDDILVFDPALDGVGTVLDINGVNPGTNLIGGLAGAKDPDRLIATVANGRTIVEINPSSGQIVPISDTNPGFNPPTASAGTYSGLGVVNDLIYLGSTRVSTTNPLANSSSLDIFDRSGLLLQTITLPYPISAFGADDIGTLGLPPGTPSQFNIDVNLPAGLSASNSQAFNLAEQKWESIVRGDLPDVVVANVGTIDDLVINVVLAPIDGPGGVLGSTNIDVARTGTFLPALATITIDSADLDSLSTNGALTDVALHEFAHALGFGTVWTDQRLIAGEGTTNPRFVGRQATAEYNRAFRNSEPNVPVENVGGAGSANSHWRESLFGNELMSSVLNTGSNPLSRVTVAALADMGYDVDLNFADPYTPPTTTATGSSSATSTAGAAVTQGSWTLSTRPAQLVQPFLLGHARAWSLAGTGTSGTSTTAPRVFNGATVLNFNEVPETVANGFSLQGVTFGFKVAGLDSADATFGATIAPTGTFQNLSSPVLEGNAAGILNIDFDSPATNVSFAVARFTTANVPNGVRVSLFDSSLNLISTAPLNLLVSQVGQVGPEGVFTYNGTTGVRRVRLDFTSTTTALGGPRFAIDNLAYTLGSPSMPIAFGGDTLLGGADNDILLGREGNDLLNGGAGNDSLEGGAGNDSLVGAAGDDSVFGGLGNDTLRGGAGKDTLFGEDGDDSIIAALGDGVDSIVGGEGKDTFEFVGNNSANTFSLGQAVVNQTAVHLTVTNDTSIQTLESDVERVVITALGGTDRVLVSDLTGVGLTEVQVNLGAGNDRLLSDAGALLGNVQLRVFGDAGNDLLIGTESAELLNGGDGNDTLIGNGGNDTLNGDAGIDSIDGGAGSDVIDGGAGISTLDGGDGDDSLTGSILNDVINGGAGNDTLVGLNGNDLLNGMDGNDSLVGGSGDDSLLGGAGDDTLDGGTDNDTLNGNDGNDLLNGFHGNDLILGGLGDDTINGQDGNDTIFGDDGNDLIGGGNGNDLIQGNIGNDTLLGGDGDDTLKGGSDKDILLGGDGNDLIDGQGGVDTLAGNQGDDTLTGSASEFKELFKLNLDPTILTKLL